MTCANDIKKQKKKTTDVANVESGFISRHALIDRVVPTSLPDCAFNKRKRKKARGLFEEAAPIKGRRVPIHQRVARVENEGT